MAKRPPKQTYYQGSEDYAKQVSSEIIEQIKHGTAPWQKPWKPGEQHSPSNLATGKSLHGREQPVSHEPSDQRGTGRQQVGDLPADRGGGRASAAGREGNKSPVLPEPDGANRQKTRQGRSARTRRAKRSMRKRSGRRR